MSTHTDWTPWQSPYDPRRVDSATVIQDEHGRLIESADCGRRCPGCGLCCSGYRDTVSNDYAGVEDFDGNLEWPLGSLVQVEENLWYRPVDCGQNCPGYGQCCRPFELRQRPTSASDARHILLKRNDSRRWELREALLILAHAGTDEAVNILEEFTPRAHARIQGFAQCALDEGRFFASVPRNERQARVMMKREVLAAYEDRAITAHGEIMELIEPKLERVRYEHGIALRVLTKAQAESERDEWRIQVALLHDTVATAEAELAAQMAELALCEAMIAEIEADLHVEQEVAAEEEHAD